MVRRRRPLRQPQPPPAINNLPAFRPDATTAATVSDLSVTSSLLGAQATTAPVIGAADKEDTYAGSVPELIHRFFGGKLRIGFRPVVVSLPIVWLAAVIWIFAQDNGAGRLGNWQGLRWLGVKAALIGGAALAALLATGLVNWLSARQDTP